MFKFTIIGALLLTLSGIAAADSSFDPHVRHYERFSVHEHEHEHENGRQFAAPEIDGASAFAALTLLCGGFAVFLGRKTRQ